MKKQKGEQRPLVLVFLPSPNDVLRFVVGHAFDRIAERYRLVFALPAADYDLMAPLIREVFPENDIRRVGLDAERFRRWKHLFEAGCYRFAHKSKSFAIRVDRRYSGREGDLALVSDRVSSLCKKWAGRWAADIAARPINESLADFFDRHAKRLRAEAKSDKKRFFSADTYKAFVGETLEQLQPHEEIRSLLIELSPLFVLLPTSLVDLFCNEVLWVAHETRVPSLILQSGWDNLSSKGIIHHQPTCIGVWGAQSKRHAVEIQNTQEGATFEIGSPHYEALTPSSEAERNALRAEFGVAPDTKLVLFGGSFRQFNETMVLRQIDEHIERTGIRVKVVYRPHPYRADRTKEENFFDQTWRNIFFDPDMKDRYIKSKKQRGYIKRERPLYSMEYLARLLSAVDAVISPMSTLLLESMIIGKPTMAVAFGDGQHDYDPGVSSQMTHFAELRDKDAALIWCGRDQRFRTDFDRLLERTSDWSPDRAKSLLQTLVKMGPGTYSERLDEACKTVMEPRCQSWAEYRLTTSMSHRYSANTVLATYCSIPEEQAVIPGYWMHGWLPKFYSRHPSLIALHKKDGETIKERVAAIPQEKTAEWQWVSRADQVEYLREHGYRKVEAVGLPIIYVPDVKVERRPGSLLVMPPHGRKIHVEGEPVTEAYCDYIVSLKPHFSEICVSLPESEYARGEWRMSFEKRGIRVVVGRHIMGRDPLVRMKRMLSSFDFVTTNAFGSHIVYAAFCGCKVSVAGTYAEYPIDRARRVYAAKLVPGLGDIVAELVSERTLRENCPFLFVDPRDAVERREWGAQEVGYQHRLSPAEICDLFGWSNPGGLPIGLRRGSGSFRPAIHRGGALARAASARSRIPGGMISRLTETPVRQQGEG